METPTTTPTIAQSLRAQLAEEQAARIDAATRRYRLLIRLPKHTSADIKATVNCCELLGITPDRVDADVRELRDLADYELRITAFDAAGNAAAMAEAGEAWKALQAERDRLEFTAIPAALAAYSRLSNAQKNHENAKQSAAAIRRGNPLLFDEPEQNAVTS